ncbi:MAG: CvpA family protein [Sphaerochaetaceae bacterium]|nr:CvpA family protein [Sphaerochaetaceae bacterium]MDC7248211.1 CvpA family protein [Sphaerochaetaceae bacterium]
MYQFTAVDIIITVLLFMGAVLGAVKGFAREAATRFGFIIAILIAMLFTLSAGSLIGETFTLPPLWSAFIAFMVLFIIAYTVMLLLGGLLEKTLETIKLGWLDSLLGLVLGVVEMFIAVVFVIYLFDMQPVIDISKYLDTSELYRRIIVPIVPRLIEIFEGAVADV